MEYEQKIKELISNKGGVEVADLTHEASFEEDLNLGGLELSELFVEIEEMFEIDLSEESKDFETFGDLVSALNEKLE